MNDKQRQPETVGSFFNKVTLVYSKTGPYEINQHDILVT